MIADIKRGLRYDRVEDSFTWLWKAGVALGVFNTMEPTVPLLLNEKSTLLAKFFAPLITAAVVASPKAPSLQ